MAQSSDGGQTWASLASKRLDKNVMEIVLEKDIKGGFNVEGGRLSLNTPEQVHNISHDLMGLKKMMFSSWFWCCILLLLE